MENLAYIIIDDSLTPLKAAQQLAIAKNNGFEHILVMHQEGAPFFEDPYKDKLLSLFRAAYRNKVKLYIADDDGLLSGAGFGQVATVMDVRLKKLVIKNKAHVADGAEILGEKGDEVVICEAMSGLGADKLPDTTNPLCAQLVIDSVYAPMLREYQKFKGYEFAGFYCNCPCAPTMLEGDIPYMKAVADRFEKEHKRLPDFFTIAQGVGDYDEYCRIARICVEENLISVLDSYCRDNGVELIVGSFESEYKEFCKNHQLIHTGSWDIEGGYHTYVGDITSVLECPMDAKGCIMPIQQGMDKLAKLRRFIKKNADAEIVDINDFKDTGKDCYIIKKGTLKSAVGLLLEGDWCILDWENDEVYDFDKKGVYDFGINGFLCIRRKSADMYPEKLPARVGGVCTTELEYVKHIDFKCQDGKFTFTLPDDALTGKYIGIVHRGYYLKLKMGYNTYETISYPCIFPLYNFLCSNECEGTLDSEVTEIVIYEKKTVE